MNTMVTDITKQFCYYFFYLTKKLIKIVYEEAMATLSIQQGKVDFIEPHDYVMKTHLRLKKGS